MSVDLGTFHIHTQACGGSGSYRTWLYVAPEGTTPDDILEPGYFAPAGDHLEHGSIVHVDAHDFQMDVALAKVDDVWTAFEKNRVDYPENTTSRARIQNMPQGTSAYHAPAMVDSKRPADQAQSHAPQPAPQAAKPAAPVAPPAPQPPAQPKG